MITANIIASAMHGKGKLPTAAIYGHVQGLAKQYHFRLSPHWKATVRNELQRHSKGSHKFVKPHLFRQHARGVWECTRR